MGSLGCRTEKTATPVTYKALVRLKFFPEPSTRPPTLWVPRRCRTLFGLVHKQAGPTCHPHTGHVEVLLMAEQPSQTVLSGRRGGDVFSALNRHIASPPTHRFSHVPPFPALVFRHFPACFFAEPASCKEARRATTSRCAHISHRQHNPRRCPIN